MKKPGAVTSFSGSTSDREARAPEKTGNCTRFFGSRLVAPLAVAAALLAAWEAAVRLAEVPAYILPAPSLALATLWADRALLLPALGETLRIALAALLLAAAGGAGLALAFARWRWAERGLFPLAVALQVMPVVALAPLLLVWLDPRIDLALLLLAWIVAFFPVLSNMAAGLRAVDPGLEDLFRLYGASRGRALLLLGLPTAAPYFFAGLRTAGGLALIGAVVAEFAAGTGGAEGGLAWRILEAGHRLNLPRMVAALILLAAAGVAIYAATSLLARLCLRKNRLLYPD